MKLSFAVFAIFLLNISVFAQENKIIEIWPNKVPGEEKAKAKSVVSDDNSNNVIRLSEVTNPTLTVFEPKPSLKNGQSIIVCPGGGYNKLALNLEGLEIAEWLTNLGYTAFVLEYRVPKKQEGALMDIQRALRIVRGNSDEWELKTDKIGIIGFSAGGSLCARASTLFDKTTYKQVDKLDKLSARPDFAMLIYPAYLANGKNETITPELDVSVKTPPVFLFGTADDKHAFKSSLVMTEAMQQAGGSAELHILPSGGHGYGLREGNLAAETWPTLAEKWLKSQDK